MRYVDLVQILLEGPSILSSILFNISLSALKFRLHLSTLNILSYGSAKSLGM